MQINHQGNMEQLFRAIVSLQTIDECYAFFEDACTIRELQEIAQRYEVARLLWNEKSYNEVNKLTGASTATICRVKKCLTCGESGYGIVLERLAQQEESTNA